MNKLQEFALQHCTLSQQKYIVHLKGFKNVDLMLNVLTKIKCI